tara:strand:+ start:84 stop:260 length:177 start_codon:yes stop_codon:yes gene_type:complete
MTKGVKIMNSTPPKSLWKVSTVFFNGTPGKVVKWTKTKFFVKFKTKSVWVNKSFIVWV